MSFWALGGLINGIASSIFGLFVYLKNPKNPSNRLWVLFASAVAFWSYSYFLWQISTESSQALFWCRSLMLGAIFIPVTFLHFLLVWLEIYQNKKKLLFVSYCISLIAFILNFTPFFVKEVSPILFFKYWPRAGITYLPFLIFWAWLVFYCWYIMFQAMSTSSPAKRNQIKYVLLGAIIGFSGGFTNYPLWYGIKIPPYGNILVSVYVGLMAYAIIKYHLLDIKVALTRAGIFAVVYTIVLGIPFVLGYRYGLWQLATWITVFLASAGPFVFIYLRRRAEDIILKDQRRYQKALRELSKTMTRIRELDKLLKMIVLTVVDTVKVSYAGIYLKDDEYKSYSLKHCYPQKEKSRFQEFVPLDSPLIKLLYQQKRPLMHEEIGSITGLSLDSSLVIPCFMEDDLLGFLVMGSKPNHQIYTADDVLVFETLSYSTSLAIENCRFWKEIEDRQRKARLQEMDTYSYSLAHEIDNPMQIILGQAGLLQKYLLKELTLPQDKQEDLESSFKFILEAASRVSKMVSAIRDFGQASTGKFVPLKIADVIESFKDLFYPQFKAENVIFTREVPEGLGFIRGEKAELMQALVILANNSLHAMKYAKEKKINIKVEQLNQDSIRIAFSDSGYGIKKELLPIIFSPFTTTKASSEGSGMGLYNAKKIIDRHKGKIWAESEGENKGAFFYIELPIAKNITKEELEHIKAKEDDYKKKKMF
jgi:signal transduction histidine kinase